jgi:hypothetical protein
VVPREWEGKPDWAFADMMAIEKWIQEEQREMGK